MKTATFTHFHFCGGSGGAAIGLSRSSAKVGGFTGGARCIGGVDNDPAACRDFEKLVGVPEKCLDLFDRGQYVDFHGRQPLPNWREATVDDIRAAAGGESPDIVVISAPCKGLSRLLSPRRADTPKYRALNRLVLRCVHFALTAWEDDPPSLFLIENVEGISGARGRHVLDQVQSLFFHAGYAAKETTHCAGEIGGLGQRRRRFLMVARHRDKVPALLYEPPVRPLLSVGDVVGPMPAPGSPLGGPMHRLPNLDPLTWLRLGLIPAGKDWRAIKHLDLETVSLRAPDGELVQALQWLGASRRRAKDRDWNGGPLGVLRPGEPARTVTGNARATTGAFSLADPKVPSFNNIMRIAAWDEPSPCVTGGRTPSSGGISVSDPRAAAWANAGHYGIIPWDKPSPTVTGAASCDNGKSSIADRRINNLTPVVESGFILVAPDETWHRPLTILEKAALQGFPWRDAAGAPLILDGKSQAKWQERVGNAIPPPSAQAIGNEMLRTLLMSKLGQTFALSSTKQWVRPVAVALALPY